MIQPEGVKAMTLADRLLEASKERGYGSQLAPLLREAAAELDRLTQERETLAAILHCLPDSDIEDVIDQAKYVFGVFALANPNDRRHATELLHDSEGLRKRVRSLEAELKDARVGR